MQPHQIAIKYMCQIHSLLQELPLQSLSSVCGHWDAAEQAAERIEIARRADAEQEQPAVVFLEQSQSEDEKKAGMRIEQWKRNE
jgi:hypothetical protein